MLKTIDTLTWWSPNACIWQKRGFNQLFSGLIRILVVELLQIEQLSHFYAFLTVLL